MYPLELSLQLSFFSQLVLLSNLHFLICNDIVRVNKRFLTGRNGLHQRFP